MGLLWPAYLILLMVIPFVVATYVLILTRRKRFAVHYSSLSLIRQALPGGFQWRRHLPFAMVVLAMILLIVALSRPFANVTVSANRTVVMLALDVSWSMCADDVDPNRLTVAQEAVNRFIDGQEPETRVGIVAFAGIAHLVVPPTTDKELLKKSVQSLTTARGTAVGSAIARSLNAISEVNPDVPPFSAYVGARNDTDGPLNEDELQPDVVVLLTDGANTRGVSPLTAAEAARERGVQVYTVGFGTSSPSTLRCTTQQLGGDGFANRIGAGGGFGGFGGGGFGIGGFGRGQFLRLDEDTLRGIADVTGAEYFQAGSADELLEVFATIPLRLEDRKERMEISAILTALGGILALCAVALGLRWNPLP